MQFIGREKLEAALSSHLGAYGQGFFITLLTDTKMDQMDDRKYPSKKAILDDKVEKLGRFIGRYCFGRKYKPGKTDGLIRIVSAIEVGESSGRLHTHIVVAHGGGTNRTCKNLQEFLSRLWGKMYRTNGAAVFVKVDPLDLAKNPINYMTKQTAMLERMHGDVNYLTH
jgi:hypothetical protein